MWEKNDEKYEVFRNSRNFWMRRNRKKIEYCVIIMN